MFEKNQKVRALVDQMSDDRFWGVDDGTPIVCAGSVGKVVGRSTDQDNPLKSDCESWVIDWGAVTWDTFITEIESF